MERGGAGGDGVRAVAWGSRGDAAASEGLLCVCSAGCGGCAADLWLLRGLLRVREAAAEAAEEGAYRQWRGDGGD
eukprot:COSAG06_NODE_689_length_13068_cov_9.661269_6_plen_75_part_00